MPPTPTQRAYLDFIRSYIAVHRRAPAEHEMQAFFGVTPPSVHRMVIALEEKGLITRQPGVARSIRLVEEAAARPVTAQTPTAGRRRFPKIRFSVFIATSLDGFIARTDGRLDWLSIVERPGEDYGYRAFHDSIDTIVFGRKTYGIALSFDRWPYTGKRCIVMTNRPSASLHGEEFFTGSVEELVARLGVEGARHVYVDGGSIIRQFISAGLVDDLTVSVIPILLGEGVPLFGTVDRDDVRLKLIGTKAFDSGLVQLEYRFKNARP